MKIQVEKSYQSPITPPTNLEYIVRISECDDKENAEEIDAIVGYLERKHTLKNTIIQTKCLFLKKTNQ